MFSKVEEMRMLKWRPMMLLITLLKLFRLLLKKEKKISKWHQIQLQ
jgi:hypothetical protein